MKDLNRIIEDLGRSGLLSGLAGGLAGGAISGALVSKRGRKLGKKALKVGALAAVGGLAWKAYQTYSSSQARSQTRLQTRLQTRSQTPPNVPATSSPSLARFQEIATESDGNRAPMLLLRAMIAAAYADGHVDGEEKQRIFEEVRSLSLDSEDKALLFDELQQPLGIDALAAQVSDHETAVEVYVASVLAIDESRPCSRRYLQDLAGKLDLAPELVASVHDATGSGQRPGHSASPGAGLDTAA